MKIDAQGSMQDLSFGGGKFRVSEGYDLPRGSEGTLPSRNFFR